MKRSLEGFQDAFVDALYGGESADIQSLTRQPGFAVYRNTVLKGATDALVANFPTLERLVGTEWLRSAAAIHARLLPPSDARLLHYGADFPDFLDGFEHAQDMPYLGDVARLDLLWTQVHCAVEEPEIELSLLARLCATELASLRLIPRASACWIWLPNCPAYTLWHLSREQLPLPDDLDWQGEGALLTRQNGRVCWQAASAADCAFLDACAAQLPLDQAIDKAVAIEPTLNLEHSLIRLVRAGAFTASNPSGLS
ncbi:putative DNA-binding domain-containing protein [Pseudomonas sp. NPDC096917]|uniref:HvfC/BufC family peptide modification chaperone n=1 Tax=Pseudomonas sp. NPDC096917 TaxID=3364483 RepID=UPI00383BA212